MLIGRRSESQFGFNVNNPQIQLIQQRPASNGYERPPGLTRYLTGAALLVNLPQLATSPFYLIMSSLLLRMATAMQWGKMAAGYQPLRVDSPKGEQVGSYLLQMPLVWAIPAQLWSVLLHFLVSQSMYLLVDEGVLISLFLWRSVC